MKKLKFLILWILVFAMALSSVAAYAEEVSDTFEEVSEEGVTENEEIDEIIVYDEEIIEEELVVDDIQLTEPTTVETDTVPEQSPELTVEENAEQQRVNEQIRLSQYHKVATVLNSLGIYSFTDEDQESTVSRGQFAKMIADLLNLEQSPSNATSLFNDIAEHPYKNEIELVAFYGIMNGVGNSSFNPDGKITYIQAIKTIVTALGYTPIAERSGGYKEGYLKVATELKLFKGANETLDEPITFLTAVNLISLSAKSTVLEPVGSIGYDIVYAEASNKTVLGVYHKIYEDEGIMTDNGISAIGKKSNVGTDGAIIGGRKLTGMKNSYREYLGYKVKYFYRYENGYDTLLFVTTDEVYNNITELRASELLTDVSEFHAGQVVAEVNGNRKTYKIHKYADFMYNGMTDATFHDDSMKIKSGKLVLIDMDHDNVYELVMAWEYSNIVVKNVLVSDEKIISTYSDKEFSNIIYGDYEAVIFEDSYGTEISPEKIPAGSVLSVFASKDGVYLKAILSKATENITVSSIDNYSNGVKLFYGENEAELSYTYYTLANKEPAIYKIPKAGLSYTALFDYDGYIAMLTELDNKEEYAYVLAMGYDTGLRSSKVQVKLYFESNSSAVVDVANKISINGVKNKTGADIMADERIYSNGEVIPQLVKIKLNREGELSSIWIDTEADSGLYGFNMGEFSLDFASGTSSYGDTVVSGISNSRFINKSYRVTTDTKIFLVTESENKSLLQTTDEERVRVISYLDYVGTSGSKYIKIYDADPSWNCGAVVISQTLGTGGRFLTINTVSHIIDEDGEEKLSVGGYTQSIYKVLREDDAGRLRDAVLFRYPDSNGEVYKGDVFDFFLNVDGEICTARMIYSPRRDKDQEYCYVDMYDGGSGNLMTSNNKIFILGYPVLIEGNILGVYTNANSYYQPIDGSAQTGIGSIESYHLHPIGSNPSCMKYDCSTGELTPITIEDLYSVGQITQNGIELIDKSVKVLFRRSSGVVYDIFLITNIGN